jgi:type IV pilus assembly protein PilA
MVVVLIIAILLAIAIPTFLGARQRAQDRAAQSNIRNALTAEKTFYTDKQAYSIVQAELKAIEPSLTWDGAADTAPTAGNVSYATDANGGVTVAAKSFSGTCFYLRDQPTAIAAAGAVAAVAAGTFYASNTTCGKPSAVTVTGATW